MIDWNHVNNLLGAIHSAATAGPKYGYIVSRAQAELDKHMMDTPEPPAAPSLEPVTAPPATLQAVEAPAFIPPEPIPAPVPEEHTQEASIEPSPDATAPTLVERRV